MARRPGPSLRIVAGEFGGRRLRSPPADGVRPSAERTREAIFSMLGPIEELRVLDLFCGSGALGLEALSRGAADLTLVDTTIDTAAANVELLEVGERCELVERDALAYLGEWRRRFDLVLCDPPYRLADRLGPELDSLLPARLTEGARVIVESPRGGSPLLSLPLTRERRYGAAMVRVHEAGG